MYREFKDVNTLLVLVFSSALLTITKLQSYGSLSLWYCYVINVCESYVLPNVVTPCITYTKCTAKLHLFVQSHLRLFGIQVSKGYFVPRSGVHMVW